MHGIKDGEIVHIPENGDFFVYNSKSEWQQKEIERAISEGNAIRVCSPDAWRDVEVDRYPMYITVNELKDLDPCTSGWKNFVRTIDIDSIDHDEDMIPFKLMFETLPVEDFIWVLFEFSYKNRDGAWGNAMYCLFKEIENTLYGSGYEEDDIAPECIAELVGQLNKITRP